MNKWLSMLAGAAALFALPASAALIGSINSGPGGGMVATEQWANGGASLSWEVYQTPDNLWHYDYDWEGDIKALSHIIIGVSLTFTESNIFPGTTTPHELNTFGSQGNSNPGIPGPLYGIKFDTSNDPTEFDFSIVSDRAPTWVDMYAKDGVNGGPSNPVYAHNASFGNCLSNQTPATGSVFGCILGPDTRTDIPEPLSLALLGFGAAGLMAVRCRRQRA